MFLLSPLSPPFGLLLLVLELLVDQGLLSSPLAPDVGAARLLSYPPWLALMVKLLFGVANKKGSRPLLLLLCTSKLLGDLPLSGVDLPPPACLCRLLPMALTSFYSKGLTLVNYDGCWLFSIWVDAYPIDKTFFFLNLFKSRFPNRGNLNVIFKLLFM